MFGKKMKIPGKYLLLFLKVNIRELKYEEILNIPHKKVF